MKRLSGKQLAWRKALRQNIPTLGKRFGRIKSYLRKRSGYYGGAQTSLCTVCRRTAAGKGICCGYYTININARIEVPAANAKFRWKQFLKLFPQYRLREDLKIESV